MSLDLFLIHAVQLNIRQQLKIKILIFFRQGGDTLCLQDLEFRQGDDIFVKGNVYTDPEFPAGADNVIIQIFVSVAANDWFYRCFDIVHGLCFRRLEHQVTKSRNNGFDRCRQHKGRQYDGDDLIQIWRYALESCKGDNDRKQKGDGHSKGNHTVDLPGL